jgi:membrane associated rhomboid family serine protease
VSDEAPRASLRGSRLTAVVLVAVHVATALAVARPGLPLWRAALMPRSLPHRVEVGGQYAALVPTEPWRLCTTVLLHVDALHLALNVAALLALGPILEVRVGTVRWVAWLVVGGVVGAAVSHLAGVRLSDGASGGAFALVGAALVIGWRGRASLSDDDRFLLGPVLGGFLALNLVLTLVLPQVNAAAHLGGLGAGIVLGAAAELPGMRVLEGIALAGFVAVCVYGWALG